MTLQHLSVFASAQRTAKPLCRKRWVDLASTTSYLIHSSRPWKQAALIQQESLQHWKRLPSHSPLPSQAHFSTRYQKFRLLQFLVPNMWQNHCCKSPVVSSLTADWKLTHQWQRKGLCHQSRTRENGIRALKILLPEHERLVQHLKSHLGNKLYIIIILVNVQWVLTGLTQPLLKAKCEYCSSMIIRLAWWTIKLSLSTHL